MKNILFLVLGLFCQSMYAQLDTVNLEVANLSDKNLLRFSETQSKQYLSDSVIQRNGYSLISLLNFNSSLYFKENGAGMVASPSFRGTTASQTAVVWNGININSQFLGQTDFNNINTPSFDNITIKSGGGSIAYGSGAIGGSIHLNNLVEFNKGFHNQLTFNSGSFGLYGANLQSKYSNAKFSIQAQLGRNASDNDYPYLDSDRKNLNAHFYNNNLSLTSAYKINPKNSIQLYANLFDGQRHFSLVSPNAMRTKYKDFNTRFLLEWNSAFQQFNSNLKMARLSEEYNYYPNIYSDNYEFGEAETWLAKYDLSYTFKNLLINALLDFNYAEAKGSQVVFAKRQTASAGLLMKHKLTKQLLYEASIRQEISDVYQSPFLYSFGIKYDVTNFYQLRVHTSKNYRMPTFNDLFWPGSGNLDLKAETSVQSELGQLFKFGHLNIEVTAYYNSVKDLIQWIPMGSISIPENVGKVKILGVEANLNYSKKWNHQELQFNLNYNYNESEDQKKSKQLIYVPFHKAAATASYNWRRISAYYQILYNGKVFTDGNNQNELEAYSLSNLGMELSLGKTKNYNLGVQLKNIWNQAYQNVLNRPMPGINYNVYFNFKF